MIARMRRRATPQSTTTRDKLDRVLWWTVCALVMLVPLWVAPGSREPFRTPAMLVLRGGGIVLVTVAVLFVLEGGRWNLLSRFRAESAVAAAAILLPAIGVARADDWRFAVPALLTSTAGVMIAVAVLHTSAPEMDRAVQILLPASLLNALVALLQSNPRWNDAITGALVGSFQRDDLARVSPIGLLGNRNDLGSYLIAPALAAAAMSLASSGRKRLFFGVSFAILASGLFASNTVTAIATFVIAFGAMLLLYSPLKGFAGLAVVLAIAAAAIRYAPPLRTRAHALNIYMREGRWDELLSRRGIAFLAAAEMIRDHPIAGVGAGSFGRHYFEYKPRAEQNHRSLLREAPSSDFFEQAHSDHLQILAETGIPGYAVFLAALLLIARPSFRKRHPDAPSQPLREASRLLAFPLALSFAVLAMAQYPLRLAASIVAYSFVAAVAVRWSEESP